MSTLGRSAQAAASGSIAGAHALLGIVDVGPQVSQRPEMSCCSVSEMLIEHKSSHTGQSTSLPEVELLKKATKDRSVPGGQLLSAIVRIEKQKLDVSPARL